MEKRGSRYLRYALYNSTKYVCYWDASFADYLARKRAEGKHYNVAISHAAKKLVRLIFAMQHSGQTYSRGMCAPGSDIDRPFGHGNAMRNVETLGDDAVHGVSVPL